MARLTSQFAKGIKITAKCNEKTFSRNLTITLDAYGVGYLSEYLKNTESNFLRRLGCSIENSFASSEL